MTQHTCAHPHCLFEGTFPAPVDPRNLRKRQYFCQAHIKEFNKAWNGLKGFNPDDIFNMQQGVTWERPTWSLGVNGSSIHSQHHSDVFETANDLFNFFRQRQKDTTSTTDTTTGAEKALPADVEEACHIFAMRPPFEPKILKQKYHALIKENHPDKHGGNEQAEELVKRINVSYQILSEYIPL